MVVIWNARAQGNALRFEHVAPPIRKVFLKNGFLKGSMTDTHNTTMPVTQFRLTEGVEFSLYAKTYLARREMPRMTEALKDKFFEGIDELFANSALHSKSRLPVAVCGQFYPNSNRLSFSITDSAQAYKVHFDRTAERRWNPRRRLGGRWSLTTQQGKEIFREGSAQRCSESSLNLMMES